MRKDGAPPVNPVGKIFLCFETKPFLATLLAVTLVMLVWNLQPYYENLIAATSRCSAATESLPIKSTTLAGVTPLAEKKLVSSPLQTPTSAPSKPTATPPHFLSKWVPIAAAPTHLRWWVSPQNPFTSSAAMVQM
ncbi:UNVERIFIED_CONTAM: Galactan beta-1,4-galactosyltransferase GALS1 [Sesamum latifolium]|uniref:Galactan beta-1,4-galactosyltransferase GALS1 n=1 Tax=Sesamum latifolium TaxID=2727402 RepID=A0AAW2WIR2_9LAMI